MELPDEPQRSKPRVVDQRLFEKLALPFKLPPAVLEPFEKNWMSAPGRTSANVLFLLFKHILPL
jgi:hypothetical protein